MVYAKPPFGGPQYVLHYLGPLHPSCRDFQPSFGLLPKRPSQFPLEGLRPWQPATDHDPQRRRILAPIPLTRPARASCASVSSASSPTADAPLSCPFADNCLLPNRQPVLCVRLHHRHCPRGLALSAVDPCSSSRGSPRSKCSFKPVTCEVSLTVPEPRPVTNTLRAPARTLEVCARTERPAAPHPRPAPAVVVDRPNVRPRLLSKVMPQILLDNLARRIRQDRIQLT